MPEKKEAKVLGSGKFSLNMDDVAKVAKSAVLVGVAAALTFVVDSLGEIEMGENLLIVIPMVTMGLHAAIRWVNDYTNPDTDEDETDDTPETE